MKKITALFLALLMLLTVFTGCGSKEDNTLTVGFDANFPPFGYMGDDGEYTGFDLEMAAEVAKRLGMELKLQPIDWNSKDFELESGNIDCIWNGFTMNDREDLYTWTDAYMDNSQVVVVRKDSGITSLKDLAGKTVMVQKESSAQSALAEDEFKDLVASFGEYLTCAEYNSAFMDLESKAIHAIAMDIGVANFQIDGRTDKFMILEETIADEQYGVGFLLGNTELRDKVQNTLMEMVKDGTFATISKKWFGYDVCILGK
ncbi:MAG: amino acid ABC transporter substrate-binding protein [Clostridiales bacterium]|nr:amino acid ABC transporter substrate-binding protein [Clostridiales bacterium]